MRWLWVMVAASSVAACKDKSATSTATGPGTPATGSSAPATGSSAPATGSAAPVLAAGGELQNKREDPVKLACTRQARDVKGSAGTSYYVSCPEGCAKEGSDVWGTGLYTDDSTVCAAARHAGAITDAGGTALITWAPGQPTYIGSERNGVKSRDYHHWGRSFFVQAIDALGHPTTPPVAPVPEGAALLSCSMDGGALTGPAGTVWHVTCPAGCPASVGRVWGTDVYTTDSTVCLAARHVGLLGADGGKVDVKIGGGKPAFTGTTRNGVESQDYGKYDRSYELARN